MPRTAQDAVQKLYHTQREPIPASRGRVCAGAEFVLGLWGSTPYHDIVHRDSLFWLICFEVVILGLGLSLQNWEISLSPGLWIEWSHRQESWIATSVVCGRTEEKGWKGEVAGDRTRLTVTLFFVFRLLERVCKCADSIIEVAEASKSVSWGTSVDSA